MYVANLSFARPSGIFLKQSVALIENYERNKKEKHLSIASVFNIGVGNLVIK